MWGRDNQRGRESGQAMIEFAVLISALSLMLLGVVDLGRGYRDRIQLLNAVRDGARYATLNPTTYDSSSTSTSPDISSIQGAIQNSAPLLTVPAANVQVTYYTSSGTKCADYNITSSNALTYQSGYSKSNCITPGSLIDVSASYTFSPLTPLVSWFFQGHSITIAASATMVEEQ